MLDPGPVHVRAPDDGEHEHATIAVRHPRIDSGQLLAVPGQEIDHFRDLLECVGAGVVVVGSDECVHGLTFLRRSPTIQIPTGGSTRGDLGWFGPSLPLPGEGGPLTSQYSIEDILSTRAIFPCRSWYPRNAMARKEPNRSTDSAILVRLTARQRRRLDLAVSTLVNISGLKNATVPISRWVLECALSEAERILGPEPAHVIEVSQTAIKKWAKHNKT